MMYGAREVTRDFDIGLSIDYIVNQYRKSKEVDADEKIGERKARREVCEIIYDHVPKHKAR